ncbi:MAG: type IV secretory system conjugative DNA transfer family protein [Formosimonas sp.]
MTNTQKKLIFWIVLLLGALLAGSYLSAYILRAMLKLSNEAIGFKWYFNYVQQMNEARVLPFATKIKTAGFMGFGLALLPLLVMGFLALRKPPSSIHGDARFAHNGDLSKVNFFKPTETSIVVGKKDGKLLHFSGQQFVILAAPTRSGKGVGIVIPNLLSYQGSMVVLDIKQENFDLTSGYRNKVLKQDVFLFNPFAEDGRTHRWNPLSYVSDHPHHRVSDLSSIAAMLYPDAGADQKFWVAQARNAFLAFALYLFDLRDYERKVVKAPTERQAKCTLGAIFRLSSGDGSELKPYLQGLSQQAHLSDSCKTAFAGLLSQAEETFSSIMGTFKEPLNPWINPIVDQATSADDFLLTDVRKKKMTVYIGILPNKLAESRLIVNLLFSQLINLNTKELPQNNSDLKHQCLLLMDEFTSIGKVDIIATAVSYMAGYNIRLLPIIQSMAQLDATYGKEQARTLITNHAMQIIYAPREQQDANDYSDMLGYKTVRKESISRGREVSRSENEERRALMLPQELKAMGPDKEVFLYEGLPHPVMCEKIKYYQDKMFTERLIDKVDVQVLKI